MELKPITMVDEHGVDLTDEISSFIDISSLERAAPGRYSRLLVLHLYGALKAGRINPQQVIREINALEGIGPKSQLKPPIQNKYPPLKGLWHKHYLDSGMRSHAMNIKKALDAYGMPYAEQKVEEARVANELRYFTADDIKAITHDVVHNNYTRLAEDEAIAGEWLIFAKHEGKNYYLCIGTHDKSNHEMLRQQIDALCCFEFPFLRTLLDMA